MSETTSNYNFASENVSMCKYKTIAERPIFFFLMQYWKFENRMRQMFVTWPIPLHSACLIQGLQEHHSSSHIQWKQSTDHKLISDQRQTGHQHHTV